MAGDAWNESARAIRNRQPLQQIGKRQFFLFRNATRSSNGKAKY